MNIDSNLVSNLVILDVVLVIVCIVLIGFLAFFVKKYFDVMRKLGKGENLDDMLKLYIDRVNEIHHENEQIQRYCNKFKEYIFE